MIRLRILLLLVATIPFSVAGCCVTPEGETDGGQAGSSLPAPVLVSPVDGIPLPCATTVTLEWKAVSPRAGIAEYQVEVERSPIGVEWKPYGESPWTGVSATELEIPIECGWHYRWRVRAVDKAGNVGGSSEWAEFLFPVA
jgi:hypothetical protein